MNGCFTTIKYVIFFFNFIFGLATLAIIIFGSFILWNYNYYGGIMDNQANIAGNYLIVIGCYSLIVSILGCLGAIRERNWMLYTHSGLIFVSIGGFVTGIALIYQANRDSDTEIHTALLELINKYSYDEKATKTWNRMQKWLKCCGVDGPSDWLMLNPPQSIPDSCSCHTSDDECMSLGIYKNGCSDSVNDLYLFISYILSRTAMAFTFFAILGTFFTCLLSGAIRKDFLHNSSTA